MYFVLSPNVRVFTEKRGEHPSLVTSAEAELDVGFLLSALQNTNVPLPSFQTSPATKKRLKKQTQSGWLIKNTNAFVSKYRMAIMPGNIAEFMGKEKNKRWPDALDNLKNNCPKTQRQIKQKFYSNKKQRGHL